MKVIGIQKDSPGQEPSLPARGAWIEIRMLRQIWTTSWLSPSLPARGAWIEIFDDEEDTPVNDGRSREGSVD